ncbi:amino acid permease-like protein 1 [Elsinoe australis]|uniref:Amino acid permease-like protein 1 n=1 Tax=Elsinoe australis TaxID=40998 RepID=A0A4U7B879_9PEZI|nr:amino acid permease-like protein 1 [Elsinoe australis]
MIHDQDQHSTKLAEVSGLTNEEDAMVLAAMGYKQELKRTFTKIDVFGIAFSTMGLLPSKASTMSYSIPAGPAVMIWEWFIAGGLIFIVGTSMAELGSSLPTSGGLHLWTHCFLAQEWKNPLCFLVRYSNTMGLFG